MKLYAITARTINVVGDRPFVVETQGVINIQFTVDSSRSYRIVATPKEIVDLINRLVSLPAVKTEIERSRDETW